MPAYRGSSRARDRISVSCLLHWQAGSLPLVPSGKHMTPQTLSDSFNFQPVGKKILQGNPSLHHIQRGSKALDNHSFKKYVGPY